MSKATEIKLADKHPLTGNDVFRKMLEERASDQRSIIDIRYCEYQKDVNGNIYQPTYSEKTYSLSTAKKDGTPNGSFEMWDSKVIDNTMVGITLGDLIREAINTTMATLPIDCVDNFLIEL